jgi:hypothetical protein
MKKVFLEKGGKEDGLVSSLCSPGLCPAVVCFYGCIYALERDGFCIFGFMLK